MSAAPTGSKPAKRSRRRVVAGVLAAVLLIAGAGLLLGAYSFLFQDAGPPDTHPVTSLSPSVRTETVATAVPTPTGSGPAETETSTTTRPPVSETTIYVPVEVEGPAPQESGLLALVTTVSGLLASLAGIVSAIVSIRAPRQRS